MGKIVATPTAGSCGILPGALLAAQEDAGFSDAELVSALFAAAAVGRVIALQATISGAEGGCQAECGAAAGMAGAALTQLYGGTPIQACRRVRVCADEYDGTGLRPGARAGGGALCVPKCWRRVSGSRRSADGAVRHILPHTLRRGYPRHEGGGRRSAPKPAGNRRWRLRRLPKRVRGALSVHPDVLVPNQIRKQTLAVCFCMVLST